MTLNATVAQVTSRIAQRSQATRAAYLQQLEEAAANLAVCIVTASC